MNIHFHKNDFQGEINFPTIKKNKKLKSFNLEVSSNVDSYRMYTIPQFKNLIRQFNRTLNRNYTIENTSTNYKKVIKYKTKNKNQLQMYSKK